MVWEGKEKKVSSSEDPLICSYEERSDKKKEPRVLSLSLLPLALAFTVLMKCM